MRDWGQEVVKHAKPNGEKAKEATKKVEAFGDKVVSKVKDTFN